jgi:hypothetical protein
MLYLFFSIILVAGKLFIFLIVLINRLLICLIRIYLK